LVLLLALRLSKRISSSVALSEMTFVEMGPGPMRLASLKRRLFRQVYFVDISDFGIPDPGLKIMDLENCQDSSVLVRDLPGAPQSNKVLLFADHCLEHLSKDVLEGLLNSIRINGFRACFRVPNILSPTGLGSFRRDSTHRTPFDPAYREDVKRIGFAVFPWIRWYRPVLAGKVLLRRESPMQHAEEIVLFI
jgi:hypothetical protein